MEPRADYISTLSEDPLRVVINKTSAFNIINFPNVSKYFSFFKALPEYKQALDDLRQLLSATALGELDNASAIWSKDPSFLSCRGTVYHPNRDYTISPPIDIPIEKSLGRYKYVDRTPWQILCMNEEWDEAEIAGEHMTQEEKAKQYDEIFPNGNLFRPGWNLEEAKKLLKAVFDAVINDKTIDGNDLDKMSDETRTALKALYAYVKPNPEHQTGLVFDANLYLAALDLFDDPKLHEWKHCRFWNVRVEETLASLLPTKYLRPHAQGIFQDKVERTWCILSDKSSYFSFRRSSNALPGLHFWVDVYGLPGAAHAGARADVPARPGFSKLMSSNNESKDRLYAAIFTPKSIGGTSFVK